MRWRAPVLLPTVAVAGRPTSLHSLKDHFGHGWSAQLSVSTLGCSLHSRSTKRRPKLFMQYDSRLRLPRPHVFEHCARGGVNARSKADVDNVGLLVYLRPGAVLPALEQTVAVTRLPGARLDGVGAGAGVDSLALPFQQAVLHTLDVQAAVA